MKGIQLLSSADFTHPIWFAETQKKLKESEFEGFYEYGGVHYVLGSEISCIYSQGGVVRRIHCLLFFPDLADVVKFNSILGKRANLRADGRPIIGLPAKNLLELALRVNPNAILIPAHAWTPWFSLYGSNSGFDSIEECFGDLSKYIYAVETGLSSDPAMNWRIPELDGRSIVSFSDAHSAPKMGREVTVFDTDFDYPGLVGALQNQKIKMTLEFFPEEGKYHFTGHRNCNVRHSPTETAKEGIICPQCKKKLTIGVMHRVGQLASKDRAEDFDPKNRPPFRRMVPLLEILAESLNQKAVSPKVYEVYKQLISKFGSEFSVLLKTPTEDLELATSSPRLAQGIDKVRRGDIVVEPGYDGVYGVVKIWPEGSHTNGSLDPIVNKEADRNKQNIPEGQETLF